MKSFVDADGNGGVVRRGEVSERVRERFGTVRQGRGTQHLLYLTLKHKEIF